MKDFRNNVIVGNVVLCPSVIRQFLAKSHYYLSYNPKKELLTFDVNHGSGGQTLFEIRNISYESAAKLAEGLGLNGDGETPLHWSKWNPVLHLHHDGSEDAEALRLEMLMLGIPHTVIREQSTLGLVDGNSIYQLPLWPTAKILQHIREVAERYKDNLATKP